MDALPTVDHINSKKDTRIAGPPRGTAGYSATTSNQQFNVDLVVGDNKFCKIEEEVK